MNLIGYIRVASGAQPDSRHLDTQERDLQRWARAEGHRLVKIYADEGVSGMLADRPGLGDALRALRTGSASGMVVPRLDRLARDLVVQEQLIAEVRLMSREIFSAAAAENGLLVDDPDDPSRKFIRQIIGAMNEYEHAMAALRLRAGPAQP